MTVAYTMDDLWTAAQAAVRAPSLHNGQPWRFRLRGGRVRDVVER